MQRQFIFGTIISYVGIIATGCGTTSGEPPTEKTELTVISPDNTSNTNSTALLPTLETNLTSALNPQPSLSSGIAQFNRALELEKSGKVAAATSLYINAADQNVREAQYNLGNRIFHWPCCGTGKRQTKACLKLNTCLAFCTPKAEV